VAARKESRHCPSLTLSHTFAAPAHAASRPPLCFVSTLLFDPTFRTSAPHMRTVTDLHRWLNPNAGLRPACAASALASTWRHAHGPQAAASWRRWPGPFPPDHVQFPAQAFLGWLLPSRPVDLSSLPESQQCTLHLIPLPPPIPIALPNAPPYLFPHSPPISPAGFTCMHPTPGGPPPPPGR
jgi:hypothetical protein